jgi:hypothetical protein
MDLAAPVDLERPVRDLYDLDAPDCLHRRDHPAAMLDAGALDGYLADRSFAARLDRVDGDDRPVGPRYGGRDPAEQPARVLGQGDAQGERELCGWSGQALDDTGARVARVEPWLPSLPASCS